MNIHKATLALVILVIAAAFLCQHNRTREMQVALESFAKDRDALKRQVSNLNQAVAEAKARAVDAAPAIEAPRIEAPVAKPAPLRAEDLPAIPGVTRAAPAGWAKNGSKTNAYVVGVDSNTTFGGLPSAYVQSLEPSVEGFGGMMQTNSAEEYAGKRVRLSGWMKTEEANEGGGHLWLRVDGKQIGAPLQFDNMDGRAPKGTTDWQQYSVVLDVPPESSAVAYGFFVQGGGKMWVSGTKLEPVGAEVPSTNMIPNRARALPKTPTNLSFDPNQPK